MDPYTTTGSDPFAYDPFSFDYTPQSSVPDVLYDPGAEGDVSGWYVSDPSAGFGAVYDPGAENDSTLSGDPSDPTSGFGAVYDPGADNDSTISGWNDPQVDGSLYDPGSDTDSTSD